MKKNERSGWIITVALIIASGLSGCGSENGKTVSTDGSTSMEKVIGFLSEAYMNKNSDVKVTYNPTGSGSGIQAVSEGRCDIGLSSRHLKDEEKVSLKKQQLRLTGLQL